MERAGNYAMEVAPGVEHIFTFRIFVVLATWSTSTWADNSNFLWPVFRRLRRDRAPTRYYFLVIGELFLLTSRSASASDSDSNSSKIVANWLSSNIFP